MAEFGNAARMPRMPRADAGSTSIQVMRRMLGLLEELRDEARPEHRAAVEEELARLEATVRRTFADSVDLDRANAADPQGIGGRTTPPGPTL